MSTKTGTAALDSVCRKPLPSLRRVPRHPAGASAAAIPRSNSRDATRPQPFQQARIAIRQEEVMNSTIKHPASRDIRTVLPVILRITLSLILWTVGAAAMNLAAAEPKEHRIVHDFAVDRAKIEDLQSWVNAGHDSWCRDPQLVAATALRRVSPNLADYELASLPLELERSRMTSIVYTFHSLNGNSTYRVTLRRHHWLLPISGSLQKTIWVPERVEIIARDTID